MTTQQHILTICVLALGSWLYIWPIAAGMLYFFATINGDITWKRD
jgi:hypothetical protein